jgi:hypothetical protein
MSKLRPSSLTSVGRDARVRREQKRRKGRRRTHEYQPLPVVNSNPMGVTGAGLKANLLRDGRYSLGLAILHQRWLMRGRCALETWWWGRGWRVGGFPR